jgi:uncharacterized membrane protein YfcA
VGILKVQPELGGSAESLAKQPCRLWRDAALATYDFVHSLCGRRAQIAQNIRGVELIELLMATLTIWIGAFALTRVDLFWLSILLGMLLIIYSLVNLAGFRPTIPARHEIWTGAVAGVANGLLTGMTGSFVVPGVLYLQAISLPRDTLVQAMGILFTLSTIALSVALAHNGWLSGRLGLMSIAAVMPAMAGMLVGQRIRKSLSENLFRKIFYISLLMLGLYIVINTSVIGT